MCSNLNIPAFLVVLIHLLLELLRLLLVRLVVILLPLEPPARLELPLVRVRGVPHPPHGVVVRREAVSNAPVEGLGGLGGGVHVYQVVRSDVTPRVIDGGVNDAIPDGLSHDELGRRGAGQAETVRHVVEGDAGIGHVQAAEAGLDDRVGKAGDEGVGPVLAEAGGALGDGRFEEGEVSPTDGLGDLKIGTELGDHALGEEDVPFGDLSHEELHDDEESLDSDAESKPSVGRSLAEALGEVREC
mmetsp:Transcript_22283/g.66031  ORF Transcript_22283/g.66031 Transcript_22283/m.66031 type:complete len:244 (-) Transcript_22283:1206-1937(-)